MHARDPESAGLLSADGEVPYAGLTPDVILDAVEALGPTVNGRLLALNSYENRVYQVGVEDQPPLIVKFYRPGRWSDAAIQEEHEFAAELMALEIPVVAPLANVFGCTLHTHAGYRYSVSPRCAGRPPELDDDKTLEWLGRLLARLHNAGAMHAFKARAQFDIDTLALHPSHDVLTRKFVTADLIPAYRSVVDDVITQVRRLFDRAGAVTRLRLHGDCHPGNILWNNAGPHFVDLDDSTMGPAIQDLWMLLAGDRQTMAAQLVPLLDGYTQFREFNAMELHLLEALRSLRMIHYAGWLARRWHDPAFPMHFPWFNTTRYWQDHILSLREQLSAMDEPPLPWFA